jgi:hypothetical protein
VRTDERVRGRVSESESECRGHSSRVSVLFTVLRSRAICVQSVCWCGHMQQTRTYALHDCMHSKRTKWRATSLRMVCSSCAGLTATDRHTAPRLRLSVRTRHHTRMRTPTTGGHSQLFRKMRHRPQQSTAQDVRMWLKLQLCDVRFCLNRPHVGAPLNANARATREQLHWDAPTKI